MGLISSGIIRDEVLRRNPPVELSFLIEPTYLLTSYILSYLGTNRLRLFYCQQVLTLLPPMSQNLFSQEHGYG